MKKIELLANNSFANYYTRLVSPLSYNEKLNVFIKDGIKLANDKKTKTKLQKEIFECVLDELFKSKSN